jgi:diacylglycerol kinase (ATP)
MRALLVLNPQSRRGAHMANEIPAMLREQGIDVVGQCHPELVEGRPRPLLRGACDERTRWELDTAPQCIIVAGGDGTIALAIEHALRLDVPIGIVPLGTFNDLARSMNVPLDPHAACETIARATTRTIDVACVNGVYYVNEASIGISSRIARRQTTQEKQRFGLFSVVARALQFFRYLHPIAVELFYDGKVERFRTVQLTIANNYHFGGLISVDSRAIEDGWIDCYAIEAGGWRKPRLRTYRARAFTVRTRHRHRIAADGEPAGTTPATFVVEPRALRVYVPPSLEPHDG